MGTLQKINGIALCSGGNGLELGLRIAIPNYRSIALSEGEAYCLAATAARIEEGSMDEAVIIPDLRKFDARRFRGVVGILSAGFPCQPHSVAGKREGTEDERWLWPDIDRIIDECRPELVFLENVAGLLRDAGSDVDTNEDLGEQPDDSIGGMGTVLRDLAERGYDAQWLRLRASRVGASHQRARVFILAYRADNNGRWRNSGAQAAIRAESIRGRGPSGGSRELANPTGARCPGTEDGGTDRRGAGEWPRGSEPERIGSDLDHANGPRSARTLRETRAGREPVNKPSQHVAIPTEQGLQKREDQSGDGGEAPGNAAATRTGGELGNAEHPGPSQAGAKTGSPAKTDAFVGSNGELEDSARNERNGSHGEGGERRGVSQTGNGVGYASLTDAIGGIFAPGPADSRWNEVLVLNPWLRPSVSQAEIELAFRGMANGVATILELPIFDSWLEENRRRLNGFFGGEHASEDSSAQCPGEDVREVRHHGGEVGSPSPGYRARTASGGSSVPQVPCQGGSRGRAQDRQEPDQLQGMRQSNPAASREEKNLLQSEVYGESFQQEEVESFGDGEQREKSVRSVREQDGTKSESLLQPEVLAQLVSEVRTDALRMLGNGVVPLQAAAAFTELLRRIEL